MSVINKLSGETASPYSVTQEAEVVTEDGTDLVTLVTNSISLLNSSGQLVDVTFKIHISGEDTTPVFPSTPGKYRVTVESI